MIPNPILKVLSSIQARRVRALLMGGQACVLYGAAEFSRDVDFAIHADPANLKQVELALRDLEAEAIAVPPFTPSHLAAGHAAHFRCRNADAAGIRVDIMSKMRGVDPFPKLWARRTTVTMPDGATCNVLSLPDLVRAKKTQRDKDWPMIRRLVEAHYFSRQAEKRESAHLRFWFRELRSPEILIELARQNLSYAKRAKANRPLLAHAILSQKEALEEALEQERQVEVEADRSYWAPLKAELETLRHDRLRDRGR